MYIKVDKIDLVNDDIWFSLYLLKDIFDVLSNLNINKISNSSIESKIKENKKILNE